MLHEILLSLSGYPSPIFEPTKRGSDVKVSPIPFLSPPEAELLSSIGRLAQLHRKIRAHATRIAATHSSNVCRAVATAILSGCLARFQKKVLDVESRILTQDASIVGGYNIVPLAGIVSEFDEWVRLMDWLWDIASFIEAPDEKELVIKSDTEKPQLCSGANIINKLRIEALTGYPDIEEAALELGRSAEIAWLRQLSSWVLYGRLPACGAEDFFVRPEETDDGLPSFSNDSKLLPKFVSEQIASSITFIGKSLTHIRIRGKAMEDADPTAPKMTELELVPIHLKFLSSLSAPISSVALAETISAIRASLSARMLQRLLPITKIFELLGILQEFFLLGRGEFALALIAEADECLSMRHSSNPQEKKFSAGLQNVLVGDGEVSSVLSRALSSVAIVSGDDSSVDDALDLARSLLRMHTIPPNAASSGRLLTLGRVREDQSSLPTLSTTAFADSLFAGVPVRLTMTVPPPLDLFLQPLDLAIYASLHAYLLALRRAHIRIASLWRNPSLRRCHPPPPLAASAFAAEAARRRRAREARRAADMRKVWATCGAALFLLAEMGAYFEGEVVAGAWAHLRAWVAGGTNKAPTSRPASSSRRGESGDRIGAEDPTTAGIEGLAIDDGEDGDNDTQRRAEAVNRPRHDPESLRLAHRAHLRTLAHALLLTDAQLPRALKELLGHADALAALAARLQTLRARADLEEDAGIEEDEARREGNAREEAEVARELDRARKRVDAGLRAVVARLRAIGESGDGGAAGGDLVGVGEAIMDGEGGEAEEGGFKPWRAPGVDRLLMKLDFGRASREEVGEREGYDAD